MKAFYKILIALFLFSFTAQAQFHEVGLDGGLATYFGDLNLSSSFKSIEPSFGFFYRYNITPHFAWKNNLNAGRLQFNSTMSNNPYIQYQNLNFRTDLVEATTVMEFNFFKYKSNKVKDCRWSPFVFLGFGLMYYNVQGKYDNTWVTLSNYSTEGKSYNTFQLVVPLGGGLKYNVMKYITFEIDLVYHHTYTDYLDDISKNYTGNPVYVNNNPTNIADPSSVSNPLSHEVGKTRGEQYKDKYLFSFISISYTFHTPHCPNPDVNDGFEVFDK